jgi:septum formation protein
VPDHVTPAGIDETPHPAESPRLHAQRLAREKCAAIAQTAFVLAADTVVAAGTRILPKTETEEQARKCLTLLSGRRHHVYTAICLRAPDGRIASRVVASVVGFARLDAAQISAYLAGGEWQGKAGGYAIQGQAAAFINFISGSYSGVVGLPLHETANLLHGLGYKLPNAPR